MAATPKQIKLIEDMMAEGAPIPANPHNDQPDFSMYDSVESADAYIKANIEFYHAVMRKGAARRRGYETLKDISVRNHPSAWNVPNH